MGGTVADQQVCVLGKGKQRHLFVKGSIQCYCNRPMHWAEQRWGLVCGSQAVERQLLDREEWSMTEGPLLLPPCCPRGF